MLAASCSDLVQEWAALYQERMNYKMKHMVTQCDILSRENKKPAGDYAAQVGKCWCLAAGLTRALLHSALYLALAFAVFDGVALVVFGLTFSQRDLAFHTAIFPVQIQGH